MKIASAMVVVMMVAAAAKAEPPQEPITYVPMAPEPAPPPPPPEPYSKTPFYISAGVTGALAITTLAFLYHGSGTGQDLSRDGIVVSAMYPDSTPEGRARLKEVRRWYWEAGALTGVAVLSGVVTTVLYSKSERHNRVGVIPAHGGAALTLDARF